MSAPISSTSASVVLLVAGSLEVVWVVSMKASEGCTRHRYTAITIVALRVSF